MCTLAAVLCCEVYQIQPIANMSVYVKQSNMSIKWFSAREIKKQNISNNHPLWIQIDPEGPDHF